MDSPCTAVAVSAPGNNEGTKTGFNHKKVNLILQQGSQYPTGVFQESSFREKTSTMWSGWYRIFASRRPATPRSLSRLM